MDCRVVFVDLRREQWHWNERVPQSRLVAVVDDERMTMMMTVVVSLG